jgi:hypothetical protein
MSPSVFSQPFLQSDAWIEQQVVCACAKARQIFARASHVWTKKTLRHPALEVCVLGFVVLTTWNTVWLTGWSSRFYWFFGTDVDTLVLGAKFTSPILTAASANYWNNALFCVSTFFLVFSPCGFLIGCICNVLWWSCSGSDVVVAFLFWVAS